MGYNKGKISRDQIIESCAGVVLAKGFSATTTADLLQAAQTSAGKLTHHFPTKESLFEAIFKQMLDRFEAGPLAILGDARHAPEKRIVGFLDGAYVLYAAQSGLVGCPIGHAAADVDGVSAAMKERVFAFLEQTEALFERAFRDLEEPLPAARAKAALFVNSWQGAIVVARAGGGLRHVEDVFRRLKSLVESGVEIS